MRLVLLSDTHERDIPIPDGDVLIHAGDLTMRGTYRTIAQAGAWLRSLPHKHKIVVAGNHDWLFETNRQKALRALGSGFIYLENEGATVEGLRIWGSPVTPTFYNWAFNVYRGPDIKKYWDAIPQNLDILVTHGPPRGILDQAFPERVSENLGCDDLLKAVQNKKPRIHVFGHIHGSRGVSIAGETTFYNASVVNESYRVKYTPWIVNI